MKRAITIALAVFVVIVVVATIVVVAGTLLAARGMPDDARAQLNGYLAHRYMRGSARSIARASAATRPERFTGEMSSGTFGHSVHYALLHNYRAAAQPVRWPLNARPLNDLGRGYAGCRPLPCPPEELWCVRPDSVDPSADIVLVALHVDLSNADWVIHELPVAWSAGERGSMLGELGCKVE